MDPEGAFLGIFLQNSACGFLRCMRSSFIEILTQFYVQVVRQRAIFAQIFSIWPGYSIWGHIQGSCDTAHKNVTSYNLERPLVMIFIFSSKNHSSLYYADSGIVQWWLQTCNDLPNIYGKHIWWTAATKPQTCKANKPPEL